MNRLGADPALGFSIRMYFLVHGSVFAEKFLLKGLNIRSCILSSGFLLTWKLERALSKGLPGTILMFTTRHIHNHVKKKKHQTLHIFNFQKVFTFRRALIFRQEKFYCLFLKLLLSTSFIKKKKEELTSECLSQAKSST